jgi:hypothetical protein
MMLDLTPLLRHYAKRRGALLDRMVAPKTQEQQLLALVKKGRDTVFGREHGFDQIRSVKDFQHRVPLRRYEQFWEQYWKPAFPLLRGHTWPEEIPYLPVSSGTTSGTTKYIPCSQEMIRSNTTAGIDLLVHHLRNRPSSSILGGRSFILGGSTELVTEAAGVFSGDLSGISVKALPWWARLRYFPPPELALLKDWEEKIRLLGPLSLTQNLRMLSGVPSWLLIFLEKTAEAAGKPGAKIVELYPHLEMLVHGGVNFAPYRPRFRTLLEGSNAELREVYPASEGFIAIADRGPGDGMRLNLDIGLFFEFVPFEELHAPNPTRHWVDTIETGVNYAVVLTTCAGLWGYVLGDTVRFIDRDPPRLLVTGRTSYYLSAFGEHLIGEEIEDAVSGAAAALGVPVEDYSVGPVYPDESNPLGGHRYVVEFGGGPVDQAAQLRFGKEIDRRLKDRNEDYAGHRAEGFGLRDPEILVVPRGTFAAWMKHRGKLGGQHKVPRVLNDQTLFQDLLEFSQSRIETGGGGG